MCKILREVNSLGKQQQEEERHAVPQEVADRNKRDAAIALGLVVLQIGVMGYTIGKITERVIKRWRNQDDDES